MDIPEPLLHCYARTLRIVTSKGYSSSFVMNHKGRQWLVTASHVVDELGDNDVIEVHGQDGEKHSGLERLPRISAADVAVFRLWTEDADFGPPLEPYGADGVFATQDAYFLGFPDLGGDGFGLTYADSTPFIKKASVSGQADYYGIKVWLLDGMNNHGFSGGPLIIHEQEPEGYRVFAVLCCYVPAKLPVSPEGSGFFVETNAGLVIGFDIRHAVEAIDDWLSGSS
jgi:hypothetical protein